MNWVGGARKRVKLQGEMKIQKEFFERKKLEAKPLKKFRRSPLLKASSVSRDLIALQTVSNIQHSSQDVPKYVQKLDQFKSTVCGQRYTEVELPSSTNKKPLIHLYENRCLSSERIPVSQKGSRHKTELSKYQKTEKSDIKFMLPSSLSCSQYISTHEKHKFLDPSKKSVNTSSVPFYSTKSCLKPLTSNSDKYKTVDQLRNCHFGVHQRDIHQRRCNNTEFEPWAEEDFQATPLVTYEMMNKNDLYAKKDTYRLFIYADQERFRQSTPKLTQLDKGCYVRGNARREISGMEKFEMPLDCVDHLGVRNSQESQSADSINDIFDRYIENRFRAEKSRSAKTNEEMRSGDTCSCLHSRHFGNTNVNKFKSGKSHSVWSDLVKGKSVLCTEKWKKETIPDMDSVYSLTWTHGTSNIQDNCKFEARRKEACGQVPYSPFISNTFKREMEDVEVTSTVECDLFQNTRGHCLEKLKYAMFVHRDTDAAIKSVGSTLSSCSHKATPETSVAKVEMTPKLDENETDVDDDVNEVVHILQKDKTEANVDGDVDEIIQVLQEMVHKVVLLASQHVMESYNSGPGFTIPSRSITVTQSLCIEPATSSTTISGIISKRRN